MRPAPAPPAPQDRGQDRGQDRAQDRGPDRYPSDEAAPPPRRDEPRKPGDEQPAVIARAPAGTPRPDAGDAARPVAPSRPEQGRGISRQMLIWVPLILLIGGGIGFAAWRLRVPQEEFARPRATQSERRPAAGRPQRSTSAPAAPGAASTPARQAQAPQPAQPPRPAPAPVQQAPVQQAPSQPAQQQAAPQRPATEQSAPVAQRAAILIQAAVNDQQNVETHVGTAVWRLEESRRPDANGSPALRADVDIPARRLPHGVPHREEQRCDAARLAHAHLPLPAAGGRVGSPERIAEMGSPQMRSESAPGVDPLAGAQAKITDRSTSSRSTPTRPSRRATSRP